MVVSKRLRLLASGALICGIATLPLSKAGAQERQSYGYGSTEQGRNFGWNWNEQGWRDQERARSEREFGQQGWGRYQGPGTGPGQGWADQRYGQRQQDDGRNRQRFGQRDDWSAGQAGPPGVQWGWNNPRYGESGRFVPGGGPYYDGEYGSGGDQQRYGMQGDSMQGGGMQGGGYMAGPRGTDWRWNNPGYRGDRFNPNYGQGGQ
ncbi:MAG TPA: hypothetical protein VGN83_18250 [Falsiroseomonas sp.]|jgi:hypothetical protein|nr:hypothetical protein [Falsiroseomonas sp.]